MFRDTNIPKSILIKSSNSDQINMTDLIHLIKNSDCVIMYSPWCGYSKNALKLLNDKHISHKSVDFDKINASMIEIRSQLSKDKSLKFPESYSTRPMIFMKGKFIGGYTDLKNIL